MITTHATHKLEVGENGAWASAEAGMYQPARDLANQGRLTEAIDTATELRIANYGEEASEGIRFRIVSTIITEKTRHQQ